MNKFLRNFLWAINLLGLMVVLLPYMARIITSYNSVDVINNISSELELNFDYRHRSSHSPVFFDSQISPKGDVNFLFSSDRVSYQVDKLLKPRFVFEPYPKLYLFNNTKVEWNGSLNELGTYLAETINKHNELISSKTYKEYRLDVIAFEKIKIVLKGKKFLQIDEVIFDLKAESVSFNGVLYETEDMSVFNKSLVRSSDSTSEERWELSQNCKLGQNLDELNKLRFHLIGVKQNLRATNEIRFRLPGPSENELCHLHLE